MQSSLVKITKYYKEIEQFKKGERVFPRKVQFDPVAFCNHDCPFCMYRYTKDDNINANFELKDWLSLETIIEILDDSADLGVKAIELTGGGEPTLHPEIPVVLESIKARGFDYGMVTNGAWRDKHFDDIANLMREATWMRVSLDSATPETHCKVHVSRENDFEKACKAIKALSDAKATIGISFIVQQGNQHELREIAKLGAKLGADYVRYGGVVFEGDYIPDIELTPEQHIEADAIIKDIAETTSDVQIVNHFSDRSLEDFPKYTSGDICYYSNIAPTIGADGKLYPCCIMKYRPKAVIADLNEVRLADAWRSGALDSFYEAFDISKECVRCHLKPNNDLIKQLIEPTQHLNFI